MENSGFSLLTQKIDEFIRKYYKNMLIKGILYTIALICSYFILIVALEYFSWFGSNMRLILLLSLIVGSVVIISRYIGIPLLKLFKLGKIVSYEKAAKIIGTHFSDVQDVLLNTLQLNDMNNNESSDLIIASIDQKINKLKPIPFTDAIDLRKNRKYLAYAIPPVLLIFIAILFFPSFIISPSKRIINPQTVFEKPAPFVVKILNEKLEAVQQEDFTIFVSVEGDKVPDQLFLNIGQSGNKFEKQDLTNFKYTFRNLQSDIKFHITSADYQSQEYILKILPKPVVFSFDVSFKYPNYTRRESETVNNIGDIIVPEGTEVTWNFYTKDTKTLWFSINDNAEEITNSKSNTFTKTKKILSSSHYEVVTSNEFIKNTDTISYNIQVIKDEFPTITVQEVQDSLFDSRVYFLGTIRDDYGFQKLNFNYSIKQGAFADENSKHQSVSIPVNTEQIQQNFYYTVDLTKLIVSPGDEITYYFEVWDNDGVNGSKSARSSAKIFKVPTEEELSKASEKRNEEMINKMDNVMKMTRSLQNQVSDFQRKMINKKELGWQERQNISDMINLQKQIQKEMQEVAKENKQNQAKESQYKEMSQELLEKQAKLQELFDKVMDEETRKLFEELQKLLDNLDKDKISETLKQIKNQAESLEKNIDRNMELFKNLEFEKQFEENIDKINKLAEDQGKLADETEKQSKSELQKNTPKQEELNKRFENFQKDMEKLRKMHEELDNPTQMENTEKEEQSIQEDMEQSKESMEKGNKNSSKQQKSAKQKMQELGSKLSQMKAEMEQEATGEDIETIRTMLKNLVKISFSQEELITMSSKVSTANPKFVELILNQKLLKDDFSVIGDSLYAISKRQSEIEGFIMKEYHTAANNMQSSVEKLNERMVAQARTNQQYAMTSVNNLANFLADALKNMQQNMQNSGSCTKPGSCNNPKPGNSGKMKSLRQLQEQLNKQLENAREGMPKPGQKPQQGQGQMSEQLARMAAQQEMLRKQLQKLGEEMQKDGSGVDKAIKEMLEKMNQTETDLVNKRITPQTQRRQEEILTRMLESEKAEQEREKENRRESNIGEDAIKQSPQALELFKKHVEKGKESLEQVPINFTPFYKNKAKQYINNLD